MKSIQEYIIESCLIEEANERIFPTDGTYSKFTLMGGDHYRERKEERGVTDKQVINITFDAFQEMNSLFKAGKIHLWKEHNPGTNIVIADCRKDPNNPVCIVLMTKFTKKPHKLEHPLFIVKTVFRKTDTDDEAKDFAALMHKERKDRDEQVIYLY